MSEVEQEITESREQIAERQRRFVAYLHRHELVSGGFVTPSWTDRGLWYAQETSEGTVIVELELGVGRPVPLFDPERVRNALQLASGRNIHCGGVPFRTFSRLPDGCVEFAYEGARWRMNPTTYHVERVGEVDILARFVSRSMSELERLAPRTWQRSATGYLVDKGEVPEVLSPSGEWFASVRNDNIVLRSTRDGREVDLTTCGTPERFWDIEAQRLQRLSGRPRLAFRSVNPWSPDSLSLLAYRRDVGGVFRIPRIHWLKPFEEVDTTPYQKAGGRLDRVEPVVIDVCNGQQKTVLLTSVTDRYIQWLGWHPSGNEAFLIIYSRDLKHVEIVAIDRELGSSRNLLTESSSTAVKIQLEEVFSGAHGFYLLPHDQGFLWLSTRSGWNHVYRYTLQGTLIGQLTHGDWPVHEISHISASGYAYFTASIDPKRPYDVHVCRVLLEGGQVEKLTRETGAHDPTFFPNGEAFLDTHSSVDRPTRTNLIKANGTAVALVSEMDISRLSKFGYVPPEEFTVRSDDGLTDLWGVMYKPADFDASRHYPVIEYIYGGPQLTVAPRYFSVHERKYQNLLWALAQLGYITLCLDARGTPGRSKPFLDAVHHNWSVGIADHAAAIRQLCARNRWMDSARVGIYGHSWGGYSSTCAIMQAPDVYHAAVSSEPGYDPWHYILSEPYLGFPQQNKSAYEEADLIRQAAKVSRPLMIAMGTRYNLVTSSVMKMVRALIEAGVEHELVVIPEATHHFVGIEEDYFHRKLISFFDRYVRNRHAT